MTAARLPRVSGVKLVRALLRQGYIIDRQRGSHAHLSHPLYPEQVVSVPKSVNDLPLGTMHSIVRQLGIDVATLLEWL
jgi:predicted RNA binding protein YcfA (HicA-like mRNA interferase family)